MKGEQPPVTSIELAPESVSGSRVGGRSLNCENGKGHLLGSEGNALGKKEVGWRRWWGVVGPVRKAKASPGMPGEETMRLQGQGEP